MIRNKATCPTPGCNGKGHVKQGFLSHHTTSGCPNVPRKRAARISNDIPRKRGRFVKASRRQSQQQQTPQRRASSDDDFEAAPLILPSRCPKLTDSGSEQSVKDEIATNQVDSPLPAPIAQETVVAPEQAGDKHSHVHGHVHGHEQEQKQATEAASRLSEGLLAKAFEEVEKADAELFKAASEMKRQADRAASKSKSLRIEKIRFGSHDIPTWYQAPYPQEYHRLDHIFVCEFCLQYFQTEEQLDRHMIASSRAHPPHPPGTEIYRHSNVSVFEIDGQQHKVYCQNLCLLAKLFLDTKTLYYDVEPFMFYVFTQWDEYGAHFVGYFSKEKRSPLNYNLSCIMTLPTYQRRGFGRAMIDFSYLLTRAEGKIGTPERPLSDLGLVSYRSYWKDVISQHILDNASRNTVGLKVLSEETGINTYDIVSTLQSLGWVKSWRGRHVILTEEIEERKHKKASFIGNMCVTFTALVLMARAEPRSLLWKPKDAKKP